VAHERVRHTRHVATKESAMSATDILNITLMQGFAGLSLFSVLLLMGLGLAVIFGQMGVINMAHGEFMTIGAYTVYVFSKWAESMGVVATNMFLPLAIVAAFAIAFVFGWIVEWLLIRHLYRRQLDTLLATWGLSLAMQQMFRSTFGPKEVSPTLPDWLMGSWSPAPGLDIPINGLFVMCLAIVLTAGVLAAMYRSRWGLRVRATVNNRTMANAAGIDTKRTDRLTFAIGCGMAGVAGAAFTTIGSTGPTSGSLYIVDSFLVVTFGGAASLLGTVASAFGIAQTQSISEFFLTGSSARVITLLTVVLILMARPQGLFASKVRRV
jgi:urea transport system permease protein